MPGESSAAELPLSPRSTFHFKKESKIPRRASLLPQPVLQLDLRLLGMPVRLPFSLPFGSPTMIQYFQKFLLRELDTLSSKNVKRIGQILQ